LLSTTSIWAREEGSSSAFNAAKVTSSASLSEELLELELLLLLLLLELEALESELLSDAASAAAAAGATAAEVPTTVAEVPHAGLAALALSISLLI